MTEPRKPPDWEAIEREFRAGQQSLRAIGAAHGVTEGAIRKKAKAEGWQRSLADRVRIAVREKLVRSDGTQKERASDAEVIEAAAETGKQVIQSHRKDIRNGRQLVERLFDELGATTSHIGELEDLIAEETAEDKTVRRRQAMERAISLPARSSAMLALAGSLKHLVVLERQAFNLDEKPDGKESGGVEGLSDRELDDFIASARKAGGASSAA